MNIKIRFPPFLRAPSTGFDHDVDVVEKACFLVSERSSVHDAVR